MELRHALLVTAGSGLGGLARYAIGSLFATAAFPIGILLVNVIGCFLIAFLVFGGMAGGWLPLNMRIFLAVGVLGGFTTMSAFAYDTIALLERGSTTAAFANVAATIVLCLIATWAGRALALAIWTPAPTA